MASDTRRTKLHVDGDGVRTLQAPGVRKQVWLLVVALALVGMVVIVVVRPTLNRRSEEPVTPHTANVAARGATDPHAIPPAVKPKPPVRLAGVEPARPPAHDVSPNNEVPVSSDVAPAAPGEDVGAAAEDEPTGLALFPPPGTKPIKRGIVVPEDFELPPGYVRHYQATDDGQRVPAILMFHPDYQPVDEHGEPIALPADRVVPPEMAPPGLPIELLEVPENRVPGPDVPVNQDEQDSAP